jgi:DNA-binding Xre family transcriptional regulator
MVIRLRLKEVLQQHDITSYRLEQSVEGVAPVTIRKIVAGERNPSFETLDKILETLTELGVNASLCDILEYTPNPPKKNKK